MRLAWYVLIICFFGGCATGDGPLTNQADDLIGLWGTEQIVAPMLSGELTIDTRAGDWRATIGGFSSTVHHRGDTVSFVLPGGSGEFRGWIDSRQGTCFGHWIQPATFNPYNQRYATPVELSPVQKGVWRGNVSPLECRVSFYISIQRGANGELSAFIRNPEANYFSSRTYGVMLRRDSVFLTHPDVPEAGTYDRESNRLFIPLLNAYPPLPFTRRSRRDAIGYYPRVAGIAGDSAKYAYRPPITGNDGWAAASLTDAGIDAGAMERFVQRIIDAVPSPDNPLNIQSLLIARHGKLVLEEYFYGFGHDRSHDMRSASKSIAPVLVGIARDRGVPIGPETPLYSLFPEYKPFAHADDRKEKITVADVMNMASGLAIDDSDPASPGNESKMFDQTEQPDLYKYTLDLPMVNDPGGDRPIYGSANTNLVGGAVRNATRRWLPDLVYDYLARPLQIRGYHMNLMPNGEGYAGGGLYMRPRDQLKLGQLYLDRGKWNRRRVVSEEWVNLSTVRHGNMKPRMESDSAHGYGFGWHFRDSRVGGKVVQYYWAGGNGGQLVIVIPRLDMVVGFTGGDYAQFRKYLRWEIEFLPQYILPAVVN